MKISLMNEDNCDVPNLDIQWNGQHATYFVDGEEVPAEVYRDVVTTRQVTHLRVLQNALDEIDWRGVGQLLERLGES